MRELIPAFQRIYRGYPDGDPFKAQPHPPSIPFVGTRYAPGRSMLIYGIAPGLGDNGEGGQLPFDPEHAWNRYRWIFDHPPQNGRFFPAVDIGSVTDGGLLAAGFFVAEQLGLPTDEIPRDFLETIAVASWCKFAEESIPRDDCIAEARKCEPSFPFVKTELEILQPAIVLYPRLLPRGFCRAMRRLLPTTLFVPVSPFQPRVINPELAVTALQSRGQVLRAAYRGEPLGKWVNQLTPGQKTREQSWRFIAHVESELETARAQPAPRWWYRLMRWLRAS
ncbi:MAG: hypothetical protein O7I93_00515 [Gemmatimonadetes bacterium]|nr:hypothetical protein [Gemmatimonadota bacterium]